MIKKHILNVIILSLLLLAYGCAQKQAKEGIYSIEELRQLFVDPPSEYRSAPLWVWHEQITEERINFQMKEFKKAGIGGVFVHPRPGLITEYLSDEWFELFDYTVQKGKELDMKVWIYDENSYPSGFAGGHVPAEMPDSYKHGTGLSLEIQQQLDLMPSDTLEVVLKQYEDGFIDITTSINEEKGKTGTYYIFRKTYQGRSPWYGGFTYVDLLYKGVTEKFMELTMTKGYEKNKDDFGKTLPGIFTDEPNLEQALPGGSDMRWTPDLWDAFHERWGYDLKINLPSVVEEIGNWKKIRHDYYELILELFIDRWAKPWSKYCDEKGLKWTGHYWEHGWPVPTHGFDESAFYIWHQQPGVDMLGGVLEPYGMGWQFGNDRAIRELRSAANQAGRIRTLSESYGGAGWEFDFEEQKRLVDWECVLGVNFVNQHLSYFSLNGVRKFDYPPSFSYHEPWWDQYKIMGDYIGRLSLAMSAGQQINKTLVLQPNTTAWMYFSRKKRHDNINNIRDGFKSFVYNMEQQHLEFDLGSENVIKTLGSVNGDKLTIGRRDYSLVVIPAEMENIDPSTLELIELYLENGGRVLSVNLNILRLDGEKSSRVHDLAGRYPEQWVNVEDLDDPVALEMLCHNEFAMNDHTQNGMLYHQRRVLEEGQLILVVNTHNTEKALADISVKGKYIVKLDLFSGKEFAYPCKAKKGMITFNVDLDPGGSALFIATGKKPGVLEEYCIPESESLVDLNGEIEVKRESDNILVINYLDLKTSKSDRRGIYFMDGLISLFKENGIEMGNPWQHKIQYKQYYLALDSLFDADSGFEASYHFFINNNLGADAMKMIRAVVERPELWNVSINGQEVSWQEGEYWIDKDFYVYPVGEFLKHGKNTITLKAPRMNILAEVMPVYLLGDFLVKPADTGFEIGQGVISPLGSWVEAGLPFYSQKMAYSQKINLKKTKGAGYKVKLNSWNGTTSEVIVNGKSAGVIAWQPYELDVTPFLTEGENEIIVKVTGSLKNTFGFFYRENTGGLSGPHSWNAAPEKIPSASEYHLEDYGLFEPFELIQIN